MSGENGHARLNINTNTGLSVGIVIVLISGFSWVLKNQSDNRNEAREMKSELSMQAMTFKTEITAEIKDLKQRVTNVEGNKNGWNATDMFKWATHLKQKNPQLQVPEPETNSK